MIKSMTAYGKGEHLQGNTRFVVELRSLNNRYRDIILRIPRSFQGVEEDVRAMIASGVRRGRVEAVLQQENGGEETAYDLEPNIPLVKAYLKVFDQISDVSGLPREIDMETLCRMNDVITIKQREVDLEAVKTGFLKALAEALDSLNGMRKAEGRAIETDFLKRLDLLENYAGDVRARAPELVGEYRDRLKQKVDRMLEDVTVDESRLAQEVAFFAERSDITEELVRLESHMVQFREYLQADDAVGRRLDFLIQEMNREVNTLGSKASDPLVSRTVVEMKAELEKLREQIQNVE
ncbi:MAG: YicC family protein [Deltaproteobacteria bacterium]|nr:YicC family protein [Deltaproteobacteria bacterium]